MPNTPSKTADSQAAEVRPEFAHHRQCGERAVGDDQRPLQALFAQMFGDELARAGAEGDRGGEGETSDGHGDQISWSHVHGVARSRLMSKQNAADPASPGRQRCPLEGERRSRFGGGRHQMISK